MTVGSQSHSNVGFARLTKRFAKFGGAGIVIFSLELILVSWLHNYIALRQEWSVTLGFIFGVTAHYVLCYMWIYRGTKRHAATGYVIFTTFTTINLLLILLVTHALTTWFLVPLWLSRTIAGAVMGTSNFLLNTFFNFKVW